MPPYIAHATHTHPRRLVLFLGENCTSHLPVQQSLMRLNLRSKLHTRGLSGDVETPVLEFPFSTENRASRTSARLAPSTGVMSPTSTSLRLRLEHQAAQSSRALRRFPIGGNVVQLTPQ